MADAGEGLIDAQNRIQERMDEREEERARRAMPQGDHDPEQLRRAESLRLAYTELLPELKSRGKTALVITHDDKYFHIADRLVKLDYGKLDHSRGPLRRAQPIMDPVFRGKS